MYILQLFVVGRRYLAVRCGFVEGATLLLAAGADRGAYSAQGTPLLVSAVAQLDTYELVLTRALLEADCWNCVESQSEMACMVLRPRRPPSAWRPRKRAEWHAQKR